MDIYLKGYYGYQNFGDELLLLGVINRLDTHHSFSTLYIESGDKKSLAQRLRKSKKFVKTDSDKIKCVSKHTQHLYKDSLKVFGGGEVVTDARKIPWNGWNYLLGFWRDIIKKNYLVLGGIGTEKKRGTRLLYKLFLGRAKQIVTRDTTSYTLVKHYNHHVVSYHDFAYDILQQISFSPAKSSQKPYIIINVNTYLRDETVIDTIRHSVKKYPTHQVYFFPAAWGSDENMFDIVQALVPQIEIYDWREYDLEATCQFIAQADYVVAARLHILLVAQRFRVAFHPFVYQEKIEKCILSGEALRHTLTHG